MKQLLALCLLAAAVLTYAPASQGRIVSVGPGNNCEFASLQQAINVLASSPDDAHIIRLQTGNLLVPNGVLINNLGATNIFFSGGHSNCSDPLPTPGQVSVLDASGGSDGTAITILVDARATRQEVFFDDVTITGGSSETGPFANPEGGGIEARGHVHVHLRQGTVVENNASGRGAGVYLNGASFTLRAQLTIEGGAQVALNDAITWGGGVYCHSAADVMLNDGQVSSNIAMEGGGVYLNNDCGLFSVIPEGASFTGLIANQAPNGAAVRLNANGVNNDPLVLFGNSANPFHILGSQGTAVAATNNGAQQLNLLFINNIFAGNDSLTIGAANLPAFGFDISITSLGICSYSFLGIPGCSGFYQNGDVSVFALIDSERGPVTVRGTRFEDNEANFWLIRGNGVEMDTVIATNNTVARPDQPIITSNAPGELLFSTVVNNSAALVFGTSSQVDFTGSILWQSGRATGAGTTAVTNGCLIASDATGLPGGTIVTDPQLQGDFSLGRNSPALDVCQSTFEASDRDMNFNLRGVDQPAVTDLFGPYDLGAFERVDILPPLQEILFVDGFES